MTSGRRARARHAAQYGTWESLDSEFRAGRSPRLLKIDFVDPQLLGSLPPGKTSFDLIPEL